jgi:ketosteroid isomerase-like protein
VNEAPVPAELQPLLQAYRDAVYRRDVAALMALYDPEVRVFDTWGDKSFESAAAWRPMVQAWFSGLGEDRCEVSFKGLRLLEGDRVTMLSASAHYRAVSPSGAELRAMHNRLSWALRRAADGWRIVHEHTSVPISLPECKGLFGDPLSH